MLKYYQKPPPTPGGSLHNKSNTANLGRQNHNNLIITSFTRSTRLSLPKTLLNRFYSDPSEQPNNASSGEEAPFLNFFEAFESQRKMVKEQRRGGYSRLRGNIRGGRKRLLTQKIKHKNKPKNKIEISSFFPLDESQGEESEAQEQKEEEEEKPQETELEKLKKKAAETKKAAGSAEDPMERVRLTKEFRKLDKEIQNAEKEARKAAEEAKRETKRERNRRRREHQNTPERRARRSFTKIRNKVEQFKEEKKKEEEEKFKDSAPQILQYKPTDDELEEYYDLAVNEINLSSLPQDYQNLRKKKLSEQLKVVEDYEGPERELRFKKKWEQMQLVERKEEELTYLNRVPRDPIYHRLPYAEGHLPFKLDDTMTLNEAQMTIGIEPPIDIHNLDDELVEERVREIFSRNHPDKGGSPPLARLITAAEKFLYDFIDEQEFPLDDDMLSETIREFEEADFTNQWVPYHWDNIKYGLIPDEEGIEVEFDEDEELKKEEGKEGKEGKEGAEEKEEKGKSKKNKSSSWMEDEEEEERQRELEQRYIREREEQLRKEEEEREKEEREKEEGEKEEDELEENKEDYKYYGLEEFEDLDGIGEMEEIPYSPHWLEYVFGYRIGRGVSPSKLDYSKRGIEWEFEEPITEKTLQHTIYDPFYDIEYDPEPETPIFPINERGEYQLPVPPDGVPLKRDSNGVLIPHGKHEFLNRYPLFNRFAERYAYLLQPEEGQEPEPWQKELLRFRDQVDLYDQNQNKIKQYKATLDEERQKRIGEIEMSVRAKETPSETKEDVEQDMDRKLQEFKKSLIQADPPVVGFDVLEKFWEKVKEYDEYVFEQEHKDDSRAAYENEYAHELYPYATPETPTEETGEYYERKWAHRLKWRMKMMHSGFPDIEAERRSGFVDINTLHMHLTDGMGHHSPFEWPDEFLSFGVFPRSELDYTQNTNIYGDFHNYGNVSEYGRRFDPDEELEITDPEEYRRDDEEEEGEGEEEDEDEEEKKEKELEELRREVGAPQPDEDNEDDEDGEDGEGGEGGEEDEEGENARHDVESDPFDADVQIWKGITKTVPLSKPMDFLFDFPSPRERKLLLRNKLFLPQMLIDATQREYKKWKQEQKQKEEEDKQKKSENDAHDTESDNNHDSKENSSNIKKDEEENKNENENSQQNNETQDKEKDESNHNQKEENDQTKENENNEQENDKKEGNDNTNDKTVNDKKENDKTVNDNTNTFQSWRGFCSIL